uniref:Uncharacterized protein n=1 Tax=Cacopsylla melanoneura TaxID=428564 RepID=A0A8D8Z8P7_9HEMI
MNRVESKLDKVLQEDQKPSSRVDKSIKVLDSLPVNSVEEFLDLEKILLKDKELLSSLENLFNSVGGSSARSLVSMQCEEFFRTRLRKSFRCPGKVAWKRQMRRESLTTQYVST